MDGQTHDKDRDAQGQAPAPKRVEQHVSGARTALVKPEVDQQATHDLGPRAVSSPEEIFQAIVRGLYDGRYAPGQRLVEADIAEEYGVSRGSVREALKRLGAEGLVIANVHRSARIRRLSRKEMLDILDMIELLTGYSCRLCALRIDAPGVRETFSHSYETLISFEKGTAMSGFVKARNKFFRTLVELSGNPELQRLMPGLHLHLIRVQLRNTEIESAMTLFDSYRQIGNAILTGDSTSAEAAGRSHVQQFAALIADLPDHVF